MVHRMYLNNNSEQGGNKGDREPSEEGRRPHVLLRRRVSLQRSLRAPPRPPAASSACPAPLQRRLRAPPVPAASQAPARWFPEHRPVYRAAGKHRCRKARRPHPQARGLRPLRPAQRSKVTERPTRGRRPCPPAAARLLRALPRGPHGLLPPSAGEVVGRRTSLPRLPPELRDVGSEGPTQSLIFLDVRSAFLCLTDHCP